MVAHLFDAAGNVVLWSRAARVADVTPSFERLFDMAPRCHPAVEMYAFLVENDFPAGAHFFNPDGTAEELCGNAIRCLPLLLGLQPGDHAQVRTGLRECTALRSRDQFGFRIPEAHVAVRQSCAGVVVDAGSPHLVRVADGIEALDASRMMNDVTEHGVNITYVRPIGREPRVSARTFERGVGETRSCGTGAIAAYVALASAFDTAPWRGHAGTLDVAFASGQVLHVIQAMGFLTVMGSCREIARLSLAS